MKALAARASRRWWVMWRPAWHVWPLILSARIQLAVVFIAIIPLIVRETDEVGSILSILSCCLIAYGGLSQLRRSWRMKRFQPWEP